MANLRQFMVLLICFAALVKCELVNRDLVIRKLDRKIDIASQLVKITSKLTLEHAGQAQGTIKSFLYIFSNEEKENVAFIAATSGGSELKISPSAITGKSDYLVYNIDLRNPLNSGKTVNVEVEVVLSHSLHPYPQSIHQGEKQLVEYSGNHYFLSPYLCTSQTTTVVLLSPNVISYSRLKPTSHVDSSINYGPYENVDAFSHDAMKIHYENNSPFLTITRLERVIEISHWGNVAVEETVDILHSGALLKGPFSRYDYQREHNSYSSVKAFKTILPAAARDVYYRDEIGNISTSHMRIQDDSVELDLRPRFPLFGGWKTHYTIGYNIPSYENIYYSGDNYILKIRFLDHVFDDMVVDEIIVKVIFPEGVKDLQMRTPYKVKRHPDELHFTYLDTFGRPVLIVSKRNLVENHIQDFEVEYRFPSFLMLQEPLLVVAAFFLLFTVVIIYVRLDLTISKDETSEAKMRVSSHCEMVHSHHDKRSVHYERIEEEIQKLKTSKDISHSQTATKKLFNLVKEETQAITDLANRIKNDSAEYAEKVNELQKNDKAIEDCLQQQLSSVEKLVSGKMNKQHYMSADVAIQKKKAAAIEKTKAIILTI